MAAGERQPGHRLAVCPPIWNLLPVIRLLPFLDASGARQMALDEALLETAQGPTARLYAWSPAAVSLGYFQAFAPIAAQLPPGMAVVRRITGGGAIWHEHEVTYSVVGILGQDGFPARSQDLYAPLHAAVLAELAPWGVAVVRQGQTVGDRRYQQEPRCFASPAMDDLVHADGGKILGSAARARGNRFLLHGSLKLATNPWDGERVAPCGVEAETAKRTLLVGIARAFGTVRDGALTAIEQQAAARIEQERYGSSAWVERREGPRA